MIGLLAVFLVLVVAGLAVVVDGRMIGLLAVLGVLMVIAVKTRRRVMPRGAHMKRDRRRLFDWLKDDGPGEA